MINLIDKIYSEAVAELDEEVLNNCNSWYNYIIRLPKKHQVVYTVVLFNWQIENGGFHQYFFNSYGQFAYLTVKNLKLIGAPQRAELLDEATHLVNEEFLIEDDFRHLIFNRELSKIADFDDTLFNKLSELDDKYYELEDEDLFEILKTYLEKDA